MIQKIKEILSSESCESWCFAFLINSIVLFVLSLIVGRSLDKNLHIIIHSSNIEEKVEFQEPISIPETFSFDDKNSAVSEEVIIQDQEASSIAVNEIDVPSNMKIEPMEEVGSEFSSDLLGQTLSGVSSNLGSGFSSQLSGGGALDSLTIEIIKSGESKDTNVVWLLDASVS